jgi:hypothetical protein
MNRSRHHTGWAGALFVAAELSRRGYDATLTFGNTPSLDILCSSPKGKPFKIQVKSLTTGNAVLIQKSLLDTNPQSDLFFAIVIVPANEVIPMEIRILTHYEVRDLWKTMRKFKKDGQPYKPGMDGLNWGVVKPIRGGWEKLPI